MKTPMELNKRLAELLGWENLFDAGGTLIGRPPGGAENSRDQAAVPDWCGDWAAAGPLMVECRIDLEWTHHNRSVMTFVNTAAMYEKFTDRFGADRPPTVAATSAIVRAAIAKLEARA